MFAVEGIVEGHRDRGDQAATVPLLIRILAKHADHQTVRNIIRFKLFDVYREIGKADLALAEREAVIDENR